MKFICDFMLGKLTKYLRMCGYDTEFIKNIADEKLLEIAQKENRILLTRDKGLLQGKSVKNGTIKIVLVKEDKIKKQIQQLKDELKINTNINLIRCIDCNSVLNEIKKENVKNLVPVYVFKTQENFLFCPVCKKIFWNGTHAENMRKFFSEKSF
jgi:hypothetical protein